MKKGIPNDVSAKWKHFTSFEKKDHKFNTQKRLNVESNQIMDDMLKAKFEGKKTSYDLNPSYYRPPEIEVADRSFLEGAR